MPITSLADEAKIALDGLSDRLSSLAAPSLRLGVTGLSRAGKTVFIAAFVHNLIHGGRLPLFEAQKNGRFYDITFSGNTLSQDWKMGAWYEEAQAGAPE